MKFWYLSTRVMAGDAMMQKAAKELGVTVEEKYIGSDGDESRKVSELLKELENSEVSGIICRGRTERWMKNVGVDGRIPVIPVQFLASSTFALITEVMQDHPEEFSGQMTKVAVFSHKPLLVNRESLKYLFKVDLLSIVLKSDEKAYIRKELEQVKKEGISFVLAGPNICSLAKEMGIHAYYSDNGDEYETLYRTLELAIVFAESQRSQQEYRKTLEIMMDYSFEGMLLLNPEGRISFCNSVVSQILNKEKDELTGRCIWEMVPELDRQQVRAVIQNGENIYGSIIRVRDYVVIVNAIPYERGGRIQGAILHMSQKEKLESLEAQIRNEIRDRGLVARYHFSDIKGKSESIQECIYEARQFAKHHANVLLLGESGTGKELFAQSIHNYSMRKDQPFVAVNCGALPMNLLESELFGYVGGAFTGASKQGKKGLIQLADKGTIFLDEISEMDLQGQVRLLRVIEERVITRIGDDRVIPVDVRIIAASNKSLQKLVKEGKFREDLYYRLNVLALRIPPLRNRGQDILLLAKEFLARYGKEASKELKLSEEAKELILSYPWKGNVRQLRNFCERLVIISNRQKVDRDMIYRQLSEIYEDPEEGEYQLEDHISGERVSFGMPDFRTKAEKEEYERLMEALRVCGGRRTEAAAVLGIGRTSLWRKMKKYGILEVKQI